MMAQSFAESPLGDYLSDFCRGTAFKGDGSALTEVTGLGRTGPVEVPRISSGCCVLWCRVHPGVSGL
jgi:hypothetical protein